jgi:F-type H+-transporting ATPase subunit b
VLNLQLSTILFQIVNFLVLLVLLRWLFYGPVTRLMKSREAEIQAKIRDAEEMSKRAEAERKELTQRDQTSRQEAEALIISARREAAEERDQILSAARSDCANLVLQTQKTLEERERDAYQLVERRVRESAVHLAGQMIVKAAGPTVHAELVDRFLAQHLPLEAAGIPASALALTKGPEFIAVETAYPADSEAQNKIRKLLADELSNSASQIEIDFRTNADLLAGLRLFIGEHLIDFSLSRTLKSLAVSPDAEEHST